MNDYPETIYGWRLSRVIHYIVALRLQFPDERTLTAKYNFSDAYRRVAHSPQAAAQYIIVIANVAYIALRLSFGGSPNIPTWCALSKMITDLSNEIPFCKNWDPKSTFSLIQPSPPDAKYSDPSIPIGTARELSVSITTTAKGRADCFIDDIIKVMLDRPENVERHAASAPLAVFVCMRPNAGNDEPVPRRENISPAKLEVEGAPAEN